MSIENKKISDEELENVTGGCTETRTYPSNKSAYADYTIPVNKYCGVVGTKYLFEHNNDSNEWLFGKLVNTYESDQGAFTYRKHDIAIEAGSRSSVSGLYHNDFTVSEYGTIEISGDAYQIYAKG